MLSYKLNAIHNMIHNTMDITNDSNNPIANITIDRPTAPKRKHTETSGPPVSDVGSTHTSAANILREPSGRCVTCGTRDTPLNAVTTDLATNSPPVQYNNTGKAWLMMRNKEWIVDFILLCHKDPETLRLIPADQPIHSAHNPSIRSPISGSQSESQSLDTTHETTINYCTTHFHMSSVIGSGTFGTVFRAKHNFDGHEYAIKRIAIKNLNEKQKSKILKETAILFAVQSEYVVKYYHSWVDTDFLDIQMELCLYNLLQFLEHKRIAFEIYKMTPKEYYIWCQIFGQILESVQYLHELNPKIIHRDLKPENILIVEKGVNGRFVKLCDFGLATVHDSTTRRHSQDVGTIKYMAPEVTHGHYYDHKSDIYSLALIGAQIFGVDLSDNQLLVHSVVCEALKAPVIELKSILDLMQSFKASERPECSQVLAKYNEWSIGLRALFADQQNEDILLTNLWTQFGLLYTYEDNEDNPVMKSGDL